jgi:predicted membrane chloride channel (bestrophin family)
VGQHCVVKHRKRGSARSLLSDFGVVDTEDECSSSSFIVLAGFVLGGMFIIFSDLVGRFWSHCKVSCAVGSHVTPADVVPDRGDFYSQVRTLDKFRKGQNLGGSPVPIFFHRYSSRNKELMSTVMRGVVGKTWKQAILNALIAGMLEWGLFYVKHCKKEYFPALELWFAGAMRVESAVLSVVSFLIAMYVEGRMAKHQDITKSCWALRGHLINLSVCLGSVIDNDEINTVNKFRMYRYLTLAHVYFYKTICPQQMDVFDDEHWLSKNILEPQELEWLKQARLPAESILCWLTNAITTNPATNEEADGYTRTQLAKRLVLIRAGASALMDTCSWLPPVSWAQLISVMVELLVAVTPVALVMRRANETEASYVWGMLGAACQALFFQGLINMVVIVEDPFGDDLDDLNPDGLLVKTEQQIQSFLMSEIPEGITSKVSGPPVAAVKNEVARYHVTVATTSPGATEIMTTAWVQLMTDESSSDQLALTSSETHHVAFEEGQTDSFTFEIAHLGEIKKIRIGHNGGGFGSGWHVDNVTVTEMETLRCWLFKIDLTIQHSVVDAGSVPYH